MRPPSPRGPQQRRDPSRPSLRSAQTVRAAATTQRDLVMLSLLTCPGRGAKRNAARKRI